MPEEVIVEVPKESDEKGGNENGRNSSEKVVVVSNELPKAPETTKERVEGKYQELLSKVTPAQTITTPHDEDAIVLDAKHIGAMTDEASKVQKLLDLANVKGVVHAVKVARSLKDYYALDTMHDELSGKFYDGLVEKGMIEKE